VIIGYPIYNYVALLGYASIACVANDKNSIVLLVDDSETMVYDRYLKIYIVFEPLCTFSLTFIH
jgi:hypothetical protein